MDQGNRTFMVNMVDPEVLADMISAKLSKKIRVTPFAKIDNTLVGRDGDTITVSRYNFTASAQVVAEGEPIPTHKLTTAKVDYKVKKIGDGFTLTDEVNLSAYDEPVREGTSQVAKGFADFIDNECLAELEKASSIKEVTGQISYNSIVDGIDLFGEEVNSAKVIFISSEQVTTLRKDSNFTSADKYGLGVNVIMKGEIGMICNCRVVVTNRVHKNELGYKKVTSGTTGALKVVTTTTTNTEIAKASITKTYPATYTPSVNDYVLAISSNTYWINPIVKIETDEEVEQGIPALTIYMKRGVMLEPDRDAPHAQTNYYATEHYVSALTNDAKVGLLFAKVNA